MRRRETNCLKGLVVEKSQALSFFYERKRNEMKEMDDVNNIAYDITRKVQETEEEFIFSTLCNHVQENYEIIVEKKELCAAIELIRKLRENDIDIYQLQAKVNSDTKSYAKGYTNGYNIGYASAMDDVTRFAEQRERIEEEEQWDE